MPSVQGKFILISGSAGNSYPMEKLDKAMDFVQCFVVQVLRLGGGAVVLGSDVSATSGFTRLPKSHKRLQNCYPPNWSRVNRCTGRESKGSLSRRQG